VSPPQAALRTRGRKRLLGASHSASRRLRAPPIILNSHREERSDEAIDVSAWPGVDCFAFGS